MWNLAIWVGGWGVGGGGGQSWGGEGRVIYVTCLWDWNVGWVNQKKKKKAFVIFLGFYGNSISSRALKMNLKTFLIVEELQIGICRFCLSLRMACGLWFFFLVGEGRGGFVCVCVGGGAYPISSHWQSHLFEQRNIYDISSFRQHEHYWYLLVPAQQCRQVWHGFCEMHLSVLVKMYEL